MIVVDSSVAVAALLGAHGQHENARRLVVDAKPRLVGHVGFETYSVLTRLPAPDRLAPPAAHALLAGAFPTDPLVLRAGLLRRLLAELAGAGIAGAAIYDGLVAGTAKAHDIELVTLDHRAEPVYRAVGVRFRFLES